MSDAALPDLFDLWDYTDPAGTAVRFHELLPLAEQSGDGAYHIELLTQIARTEGLQGHYAEAHTLLDAAEAMLTTAYPVAQMRCWLERGRVFNSAGEPATAVPLFQQAYDLGLETGASADFHTVDAAHMLGIAAPPAERMHWNLVAAEHARQSPAERAQGWRGSLLNNIGWTYFDEGAYEKALATFQETAVWYQTNRPEKPHFLRIANWSVGRTLRAMGRVPEALAIQQTLLAGIEAGEVEPDGFVHEEMGECLLALGQDEEARPYFAQAYALLSQQNWLVNSQPDRLERLKQLGERESG